MEVRKTLAGVVHVAPTNGEAGTSQWFSYNLGSVCEVGAENMSLKCTVD
jgi:hypothetical protein